jgi:hypothetical protein
MSTENTDLKNQDEGPKENQEIPVGDAAKELSEMASVMPEPVTDAIKAAHEKEQSIQQENQNVKDNKGRPFDPNVHATDKDGRPILTTTGRFKKVSRAGGPSINIPVNESVQETVSRDSQTVAVTVVGMFIQCGYAFVGDEWLPEKSKDFDEEKNLINVTAKYCDSIGLRDLPPGLVCATAFIAYGLRRVTRPKTKTVVQKLTEGFQQMIYKGWVFITNKLRFKNARSNPGNNGNGKDNAGVQIGGDIQK